MHDMYIRMCSAYFFQCMYTVVYTCMVQTLLQTNTCTAHVRIPKRVLPARSRSVDTWSFTGGHRQRQDIGGGQQARGEVESRRSFGFRRRRHDGMHALWRMFHTYMYVYVYVCTYMKWSGFRRRKRDGMYAWFGRFINMYMYICICMYVHTWEGLDSKDANVAICMQFLGCFTYMYTVHDYV